MNNSKKSKVFISSKKSKASIDGNNKAKDQTGNG